MSFSLNPLTGELDITNYPFKSGTAQPVLNQDGEVQVANVSNDGRVYFLADGNLYYVSGVQIVHVMYIPAGHPIGLAGITYANDIT